MYALLLTHIHAPSSSTIPTLSHTHTPSLILHHTHLLTHIIIYSSDGNLYIADSESSSVRAVAIATGSAKAVVGGAIDPQVGVVYEIAYQYEMGNSGCSW